MLGYRKRGDHICPNAETKHKPRRLVNFPVCTVPPFLPLTVTPGLTLSETFHGWQPLSSPWAYPSWFPSLQPVPCSAVLGDKPNSPWRAITLALGSTQSGASPEAWHAIVLCHRSTHALNPFPALQYQMDGKQECSQVQITSCSWVIESHSKERGQQGLGPIVAVLL